MRLKFFVHGRRITADCPRDVVSMLSPEDTFTIEFDREWNGLTKLVVLQNGSRTAQLLYTGETAIPAHVCGRGLLCVTCYGYRHIGDATAVLRTLPMAEPVKVAGSSLPQELTDGASAMEMLYLIRQMRELLARAQNGDLHGRDATVTVAQVVQGDTPNVENIGTPGDVRLRFTLPGAYVLTPQDKQEIIDAIDEELETLIGTGELV